MNNFINLFFSFNVWILQPLEKVLGVQRKNGRLQKSKIKGGFGDTSAA